MRRRWLLAAVASALLAACAAPQLQPVPACAARWSGRLSAQPARAERAPLLAGFTLELDRQGDGRLWLTDPLGQAEAQADWDDSGAHVHAHGWQRDYPSFEAMLGDVVGVALPRQALASWLDAQPLASVPSTQLSGGGFEQLGWRVTSTPLDGGRRRLQLLRVDSGTLTLVIDSRSACATAAR